MVTIIWTDNALFDLDEIGEYIALHSVHYAKKTVDYLFHSTQVLITYPQAGKMVLDFGNESIRELVRGNYRIVYRLVSNTNIEILTVHHGARFMGEEFIK